MQQEMFQIALAGCQIVLSTKLHRQTGLRQEHHYLVYVFLWLPIGLTLFRCRDALNARRAHFFPPNSFRIHLKNISKVRSCTMILGGTRNRRPSTGDATCDTSRSSSSSSSRHAASTLLYVRVFRLDLGGLRSTSTTPSVKPPESLACLATTPGHATTLQQRGAYLIDFQRNGQSSTGTARRVVSPDRRHGDPDVGIGAGVVDAGYEGAMGALTEVKESPTGSFCIKVPSSHRLCWKRWRKRSRVTAVFTNLQRVALDAMGQRERNLWGILDPRSK